MALVNAYTVRPNEIEVGDEMLFVVKALVTRRGGDGMLRYRLYRCLWEGDDVPQGDHIPAVGGAVCRALFPSLAAVAKED